MEPFIHKILPPKGSYGYLENRKIYSALRTVLFFLLCVGLYLAGYLTTGTNRNLLTVVAILGCLPACKSLVSFIMFLKARGCSKTLREKVNSCICEKEKACAGDQTLDSLYDMYFTSYQKNFPISHMALKGSILCGITEDPGCGCREAEKHIMQMLTQEGIKNITVNIFSQAEPYIGRLSRLLDMKAEPCKSREEILRLLSEISL